MCVCVGGGEKETGLACVVFWQQRSFLVVHRDEVPCVLERLGMGCMKAS